MKGKLPRISFRSRRSRTPSVQALIVIFIMLFILFLWMNFGLTQQIESIGREIQARTQELESLERRADAYRSEISARESQLTMSERARLLGYQPQAPLFLPVSEPLAEPVSEAPLPAGRSTIPMSDGDAQADPAHRLLLLLSGRLAAAEAATAP